MELNIIENGAEDLLYASIISQQFQELSESHPKYMHCKFFHANMLPSIEEFKSVLEGIELNNELTVYPCQDGDYIISYIDFTDCTSDALKESLINTYKNQIGTLLSIDELFVEYEDVEGFKKLKAECSKKLKKQTKEAKKLNNFFNDERLIDSLKRTIQITYMQRTFRVKPHILIVEDQIFSQKLLKTILKDYTCHVAENSGEALLLYIEKSPDIVLLDIELPDLNGHIFARFINKIDHNNYIVMVSANQYENDIKQAKENDVKAFIAKPYKKENILNVIDKFIKTRKKRAS
ncbi:MAG: response regulator [Alphaproteobacteria bacterium]